MASKLARSAGNVVEDGDFLYLRSQLIELGANGEPRFASVTFVLGDRVVATISDDPEFRPFGAVLQRCKRRPSNAESPKALLRLLLQTANDRAASVIDYVADALVQTTSEISEISDGYDEKGRELGVSDLSETMRGLNETEELILRCVEAQLTLGRSVRYLGDEVDNRTEQELQVLVNELAGDVAGTKEHAMFQHERVRYLQTAVTNILNIKQNEIIKVFTIITAVFLPPTLDRNAVRHELRGDAGAVVGARIHLLDVPDARRRHPSALVHQAPRLAALSAPERAYFAHL